MAIAKGEPNGLGGWLILPAIGLIILPIRLAVSLINDFLPIFREGYWEILTTPGSEAYHHLWAPLIIYEMVGNALFAIFCVVLIFLFFTKSYRFPVLMITLLASNFLFVISDFIFVDFIPAVAAEDDPESVKELIRTVIAAMIWIPYFRASRRVKNTFVKPETNKQLGPNAENDG